MKLKDLKMGDIFLDNNSGHICIKASDYSRDRLQYKVYNVTMRNHYSMSVNNEVTKARLPAKKTLRYKRLGWVNIYESTRGTIISGKPRHTKGEMMAVGALENAISKYVGTYEIFAREVA